MLKNHRLLYLSILVIIAIIALVAYIKRPHPVAVIVEKASQGEVLSTIANTRAGTLKACQRASLSPSIGGQIESLPVKEGDSVEAGQVLLEIWNDDLEAQVKLAEHEYQAAIARARQVCVGAEVARRESNRLKKLFKKNLASEEVVDRAEGEAQAQFSACDAANTSTKVSQASIDVAHAALARTRLTAPFAGKIAEVNGEIGEFLTPSPIGIATLPAVDLIDYTCVYVSAPIDEVDAPLVRPDMPARISLDAFAGKVFDGKVRRIAAYVLELEKQARTVEIEVDFLNTDDTRNMLPGYSADAEIILDRRDNVLRIPTSAIYELDKVLVFNQGVLEQRKLEIGMSNWRFTEVTKGLKAGEQVVISIEREGVEAGVDAVIEENSN